MQLKANHRFLSFAQVWNLEALPVSSESIPSCVGASVRCLSLKQNHLKIQEDKLHTIYCQRVYSPCCQIAQGLPVCESTYSCGRV